MSQFNSVWLPINDQNLPRLEFDLKVMLILIACLKLSYRIVLNTICRARPNCTVPPFPTLPNSKTAVIPVDLVNYLNSYSNRFHLPLCKLNRLGDQWDSRCKWDCWSQAVRAPHAKNHYAMQRAQGKKGLHHCRGCCACACAYVGYIQCGQNGICDYMYMYLPVS